MRKIGNIVTVLNLFICVDEIRSRLKKHKEKDKDSK